MFTSQTLTISDVGIVVSGFAAVTLQLLPISGNTQKWFWIANVQAQDVTIKAVGVELIDGANAFLLHAGDAVVAWNDGIQWRVMGRIGVTSVGLTMPVEFVVSGSPVTGDGIIAVTKATEIANTVWAGPTTGADAAPTFRALVSADLPAIPGTTQPMNILEISSSAAIVWVVPAAVTEFNGSTIYRTQFDLTNFTQARIMGAFAGAPAATPNLYGQFSTNSGSTWHYLDGGTGPSISPTTTGLTVSGWVTLVPSAQADVQLRIVGNDTAGPAASSFGAIYLQAK